MYYYNIAANTWTTISSVWMDQSGTNITSNILDQASGDLAMDGNGNMWLLTSPSGSGNRLNVYKINAPLPKTAQSHINATLMASHSGFGGTAMGIAFSASGEIYIGSTAQILFRLNNDFSLTNIGSITGGSANIGDLTSCAFPVSPLSTGDFGDAPNTYSTLLANNGPSHMLSFYDPLVHTSKLMLGSLQDNEIDGAPNTASSGDDAAGVDDEDGIVRFPTLTTASTSYTVTVNVTNTTGDPATLKGWIDFNKNGVFDASEGATATVPIDATTATLTWNSLSGLTYGSTYARFRIATLASEIANPTGLASDGEVEDYNLPMITLGITGNVFNDVNGLVGTPANTVDGNGINPGNALYAILYDNTTGMVADFVQVAANGTFNLGAINGNSATVYISATIPTLGQTAVPTVVLPAGWGNVGEVANASTGAGSDGSPNGVLVLGTVSAPLANANFGIQQPPTAVNNTLDSRENPGGTTSVTVPSSNFDGNDANGGTVVSMTITTFPTNATSITINSIQYTVDNFPQGGVTIPTDINGNPTQAIAIDPINGAVSSVISYFVTDNAGATSSQTTPATVTVPFTDPLPVTLVNFVAKYSEEKITLFWKTTSESNFSHFEVLKSSDAKDFQVIGKVNSVETSLYNYTDDQPVLGINYYRLKMVDLDGTTALSKVISVHAEKGLGTVWVENPASNGEFSVITDLRNPVFTLVSASGSKTTIAVTSTSRDTYLIHAGNSISGIYYLIISSNGSRVTKKVLIP